MMNLMKMMSKCNDELEELNLPYFDVTNALVLRSKKFQLEGRT